MSILFLAATTSEKVPELPNFISLLYHQFQDLPWVAFLHQWENIIFSVIISSLIALVFYFGARKKQLYPDGLQNFLELSVSGLRSLITGILGTEGDKYLPFLGTLFIYILVMNIFGMIPFMKSPSSNLNITIAPALCVFCLVQYLNIKNQGLKGFVYHLAGSPKNAMGWVMAPLMFPIELITQISRPVTLALRLFGNIFGEDVLIGVFALFGLIMISNMEIPLALPLQIPFMFLGMLTSLMQALVFTLLSAVYILLSMPQAHEH